MKFSKNMLNIVKFVIEVDYYHMNIAGVVFHAGST